MPRGLIPGHEHPSGRMGCSQVLPGVDNGKKAPGEIARSLRILMAGCTRLELATSDVTGRRSNQLS